MIRTTEAIQTMTSEIIQQPALPPDKMQRSAASYVIGADIGGSTLRIALADATGTQLGKWTASTVGAADVHVVVRLMREGVDALLEQASLPPTSLRAMAVGAPGITNPDDGIVIATSYLMGWRDVPLRGLLEAEFGVPVAIENDVNLAAIGELHAGMAEGTPDFVFLAIGTGIGAGIVLNGQLHRGTVWTAGEIGYMLVPGVSAAPVERGMPGALEAIAGGEGIKTQWRIGWDQSLTSLPKDASPTQILDHALEGNALSQQIVMLAGRALAYAIYNISLVLNCPLFVLGGTIGSHPALGDAIRLVLSEQRVRVQPKLVHSALGTESQLTGAVFLAIETESKQPALIEGWRL
jgi:glucokinase